MGEAGALGLGHFSMPQVPSIQPALQVLPALAVEVIGVVQVTDLSLQVGTLPTAVAGIPHRASQAPARRWAFLWPALGAALPFLQQPLPAPLEVVRSAGKSLAQLE